MLRRWSWTLKKVETFMLCKHMEWRIVRNMVTKTSITIMATTTSLYNNLVTKLRSTPWIWVMGNQQATKAEITWRAVPAKGISAGQPSSAEVICTAKVTCMEHHLLTAPLRPRAKATITVNTNPKA